MGSDDDDSDQDDSDDGVNSALHDSNGIPKAATPGLSKSKKKKKKKDLKSIEAAEAEARAAEEALLLELEQEDAKAQKEEAAASTKRSKKKKKRERERLQRLKEEEMQRQKAEKEKKELERKQRLKDEKERKEKEQRDREKKEKEMREAAEREEKVAAKQKEREERERRQREQEKKDRERSERLEKKATEANAAQLAGGAAFSTHNKKERASSKGRGTKKSQHSETQKLDDKATNRKISVTTAPVAKSPALKKRGWETKTVASSASNAQRKPLTQNKVQAKESAPSSIPAPASSLHGAGPRSLRAPTANPPVTVLAPTPVPVSVSPSSTTPSSSPLQTLDEEKKLRQLVASTEPVDSHQSSETFSVEDHLEDTANGVMDFLGFDSAPIRGSSQAEQPTTNSSVTMDNGMKQNMSSPVAIHHENIQYNSSALSTSGHLPNEVSVQYNPPFVELPFVSAFQLEQVTELFRRCALARSSSSTPQADPLGMISEDTIKRTVYRWIVRASHGSSAFLDPIIPSWTDNDQLVEFLQRQFISESRRGAATRNGGLVSIEVLKEAGSRMAVLCQNLAKDLVQYRANCEQQVQNNWTDATMNISVHNEVRNDRSTVVVIDLDGRSQSYIPSDIFNMLSHRYQGAPDRFLSAVFAVSKCYEAKRTIVAGTSLDFRLLPLALSTLAREAYVTMELWVEPLTVFENNVFCGIFPDVDQVFGGLRPFGKDGSGEDVLLQHGGSVALIPPFESTTASAYMQNILNLLDKGVPLSFALILPAECFRESTSAQNINDLAQLDPRIGQGHSIYIRNVELLNAGQHAFQSGDGEGIPSVSQTGSFFVLLQNDAGSKRFPVDKNSVSRIIHSMCANYMPTNELSCPVPVSGYADYSQEQTMAYAAPPISANADFSGFSSTAMHNNFRLDQPARTGGRSRLFDLVDDGDDDNDNGVDVSGMLNSLDVSMFHDNSSQDVDIEAISLMGIGSTPLNGGAHQGNGRFQNRFSTF